MKQPNKFRSILLYTAVVLALLWGLAVLTGERKSSVSYADAVDCFRQEQVVRFVVDDSGVL